MNLFELNVSSNIDRFTRNERLPQTKGGIIAFVLTLLSFIDDYTTRS